MAALSQKRSCAEVMADFKEFIWNPRTREFMGRTASSWGLILAFYLVFYAFLTAVFALSMWVMLQTIDDQFPTYSDRLANPGLMIRPKTDGLEIVYTNGTSDTWQSYVKALDDVLQDYNVSIQEQRGSVCNPGVFNNQNDAADVRNFPKKACRFERTLLQQCDGIVDPTYGYRSGQPCVLIKINRVINFRPGVIHSLSNHSITVNCSTTIADNDRRLGDRIYFPNNGTTFGTFDLMYFPYYGKKAQVNYTQPLVAIKFLNPEPDTDFFVQCRINADNINSNDERDKFSGRVIFKLRINSK
uniref:Sodium/potassium-transporting ATPase subunit beta n=1 Tax=Leptobrachium leishanense TaxID=445787 RepID=A0A8C5Q1T2_9ANUR